MAMTFKVEPRHVGMFGARGILAPLYQRQATQLALEERERSQRSQFEQAKALIEQRAQLQQQLQGPLREAQIGEIEARTGQREFELGEAEELSKLKGETLEALQQPDLSEAERGQVWRRYMVGMGRMPAQEQQYAPPTPTFFVDPETGLPAREDGRLISVPGRVMRPLADAGALKTGRINIATRASREISAKYNPESKRGIRRDYSGIDWDASAMRALGSEGTGFLGLGKIFGMKPDDLVDNIMQVMSTPATTTDPTTGAVSEDVAEFERRAGLVAAFREKLADEPEGRSKEKMREILQDMENAMTNARLLSSEKAQTMLSRPGATPTFEEQQAPPESEPIWKNWTP